MRIQCLYITSEIAGNIRLRKPFLQHPEDILFVSGQHVAAGGSFLKGAVAVAGDDYLPVLPLAADGILR